MEPVTKGPAEGPDEPAMKSHHESGSENASEFRPRISTYGGRELTPYRMRTTSHSESSRPPRARRLTSLSSSSYTKIGALSSTESLFSSLVYVPPAHSGDSSKRLHKRGARGATPEVNGVARDSETGESDGMLISNEDRHTKAKSVASSSSTDSLQMEPFESWKVLVTCTLTFVLIGINWVAFPMFYVEFTEQFKATKSVLGWIGSLQNAFSQIIGLFVSAPVQVYGCRPVAIAGGVVLGVGTALSAWSPNVGYLYFSYGVVSGEEVLNKAESFCKIILNMACDMGCFIALQFSKNYVNIFKTRFVKNIKPYKEARMARFLR